ncbi:hypothetical protein OH77DRAFT_1492234 [Trametes cingulata]|nr:hypothetical protein OH77DRAFT_1492234 [Trametes cingulata]
MPCFAHKRLPSPPPLLLGAREGPPLKRIKIIHPSEHPLSDVPSGDPRRPPAVALLSNADRTHHNVRPLTKCHAANQVGELREHDALTPERMPQTLLSWSASHQLLHKQAQRAAKSAVVSAPPWAHATPDDGCYISSDDALASSSTAPAPLPLCPTLAAAPSMAFFSFAPEAGPSTSCRSQFSFVDKELLQNQPSSAAGASSYEADVLDYLYEGLERSPYGFSEDAFSHCAVTAGEQLSETQGCEPNMASPNPQSPIFRSMSRSSFGSCSYMDYSSPGDYDTPASDSSVTTPAPSEAAFGWVAEFRQPPFGEEVSCGIEAKTKGDPQCSYVQDFPGSAPLSPNAFFSYSFDACLPDPVAVPSNEGTSITGARRHSEPANLAALQFPLFFQEHFSQIAPPPTETTALPITDNLASSSSAAAPSSIAPHQTQLPPYKPPILRDDRHYDPKDFVRRHSEPILPHLPLDVTEESAEEVDETMMFEEADEESYEGEYSSDEEASMDDYALDGLDMQAFSNETQGELFDPQWSWVQPSSGPSASMQAWSGVELFGTDIDWTAAFTAPPTSSGL